MLWVVHINTVSPRISRLYGRRINLFRTPNPEPQIRNRRAFFMTRGTGRGTAYMRTAYTGIGPIRTRCCLTMTNMIQVCSNFHRARVFIMNTRPDKTPNPK